MPALARLPVFPSSRLPVFPSSPVFTRPTPSDPVFPVLARLGPSWPVFHIVPVVACPYLLSSMMLTQVVVLNIVVTCLVTERSLFVTLLWWAHPSQGPPVASFAHIPPLLLLLLLSCIRARPRGAIIYAPMLPPGFGRAVRAPSTGSDPYLLIT